MIKLSSKHLKIWNDVFAIPIRSNILWSDIENLFIALNAEVTEGRGSRLRVEIKGAIAVFHRPHPRKETDKGALISVRKFLIKSGVFDEIEK